MKEEEVNRILKKHNRTWTQFNKFMVGQTIGVYPDGTPDYYEYDVKRFIYRIGERV